jgi:hypothetical protein
MRPDGSMTQRKEKTTLIAGKAHRVKYKGTGTDVTNTWKTLLSRTFDKDPVFFVPQQNKTYFFLHDHRSIVPFVS